MEPQERIIVPLDMSSVEEARNLVDLLMPPDDPPLVGMFKFGLEFIWSMIADLLLMKEEEALLLLHEFRSLGRVIGGPRAFLDPKLADIPNTVKGASIAISRIGVKMFNIHASCGEKAIAEAVANKGNSLVLGVTVLTSLSPESDCVSIFGSEAKKKVPQFARMLQEMGADGVICAPKELEYLEEFNGLIKVVPNVRPSWAAINDQSKDRTMTPGEARRAGADYFVIGRPIRKPPAEISGSVEAAKRIADEIASAS